MSDSLGFVPMFSPYVQDEDDISQRIVVLSAEEKQKQVAVSIDVTKALLLMGFGSWTTLEPGRNKIVHHTIIRYMYIYYNTYMKLSAIF